MNTMTIIQLVISALLILSILMQHRGTSLGGAFGGESAVFRTRRGAEKLLYYSTIILAVIFVGLSVVNLLV